MLNFFKRISFKWYLSLSCFLLLLLGIYSYYTSNYLYTYTIFFVGFIFLIFSQFVANKGQLYKLLFFIIPLSVGITLVGDSQMQLPTEPIIGIFTLILLFNLFSLKNDLKILIQNPITILLFAEVIWMLICSITSELISVSLKYTFIRFCYVSAFFTLGFLWLKKEQKPYLLYFIYAVGLILPIINGLIFHAQFGFSQKTAYVMPKPFYNDHTEYGACIAFILPALLAFNFNRSKYSEGKFFKVFTPLILFLLFVAEYLSFSRASWLSLAVALVFYILLQLRISGKQFLALLFTSAIVVLFNYDTIVTNLEDNKAISNKEDLEQQVKSITNVTSDVSNKERVNRWNCAIRMGNNKPVFGYGPRTYKFFYGDFQAKEDMNYTSTYTGNKGNAHSDYLSYFAETGYIGFAIHLLLYIVILYQGINTINICKDSKNKSIATVALLGLTTYFVHGIFNGFMDEEKMASLVFISMAILVYVKHIENDTKQDEKTL
ncbi:MAG: O-antigen ligase family protein [Bacteroidetes bacterium]|nr:O-antigen ligase family protein [Bacteroidota bacterium]